MEFHDLISFMVVVVLYALLIYNIQLTTVLFITKALIRLLIFFLTLNLYLYLYFECHAIKIEPLIVCTFKYNTMKILKIMNKHKNRYKRIH